MAPSGTVKTHSVQPPLTPLSPPERQSPTTGAVTRMKWWSSSQIRLETVTIITRVSKGWMYWHTVLLPKQGAREMTPSQFTPSERASNSHVCVSDRALYRWTLHRWTPQICVTEATFFYSCCLLGFVADSAQHTPNTGLIFMALSS